MKTILSPPCQREDRITGIIGWGPRIKIENHKWFVVKIDWADQRCKIANELQWITIWKQMAIQSQYCGFSSYSESNQRHVAEVRVAFLTWPVLLTDFLLPRLFSSAVPMFSIILKPDFRVTWAQFPERTGNGDFWSGATSETNVGKFELKFREKCGQCFYREWENLSVI